MKHRANFFLLRSKKKPKMAKQSGTVNIDSKDESNNEVVCIVKIQLPGAGLHRGSYAWVRIESKALWHSFRKHSEKMGVTTAKEWLQEVMKTIAAKPIMLLPRTEEEVKDDKYGLCYDTRVSNDAGVRVNRHVHLFIQRKSGPNNHIDCFGCCTMFAPDSEKRCA